MSTLSLYVKERKTSSNHSFPVPTMESFTCLNTTAIIIIPIILLFLSQLCTGEAPTKPHHPSSSDDTADFIKTSCRATQYPIICYKTLSSYANTIQKNPTELASAALNVTLKSAKSASRMVSELSRRHDLGRKEAGAVIDCVEVLGDAVEELHKSLVTMKDLTGPEFATKMSNVETWVSAALTDEDTCMDGFQGSGFDGEVKRTVRSHIVKVAQLNSNALALINRI